MGAAGLQALTPVLSVMPRLQTLDISETDLGGSAAALQAVLQTTPSLAHLHGSSATLGMLGAASLAPVLQGMTCLQQLSLCHSDMRGGQNGVVAMLAFVLAALPRLHTLDLSNTNMYEPEVVALAPLVAKAGSPLRALVMGNCFLYREGSKALAKGLSASAQLQLQLQLCSLGLAGCRVDTVDWIA